MKLRKITAALLALALAAPAAATARVPDAPPGDDTRITAEEEREARELLEEFNRKLVETRDVGPLVDEYFVPDFAARLLQGAKTHPLDLLSWKDESAPPDPEDLRRLYVASTNYLHGFVQLFAAAARKCAELEDDEDVAEDEKDAARAELGCDEDYDPKPGKFLPPAAVELLKSEPLLRETWLLPDEPTARDDASGTVEPAPGAPAPAAGAHPPERKSRRVNNWEDLRRLTKAFEDLGRVLGRHLAAHPVSFEAAEDVDEDSRGGEYLKFDPKRVRLSGEARVLEGEFYGYPAGTRLVCADLGRLHAELVRVDGRLRVLTVYVLIEDCGERQ